MRYIGTVMAKELNSVARRKRTFVLRVVLPLFALLVIILFLINIDVEDATSTAMMGRVMFYTLAFMVMIAGFFLAPAYTAPLISSEREQKTLEIISSTPIRHYELVLGKIGSRVVLLILFSAAAVPLMFVCMMFGGVSLREIILASCFIISNILICSGLGIFISSLAVKSGQAISRTYSLLILVGIASMIISRSYPFFMMPGIGSSAFFTHGVILGVVSFILVTLNPFALLMNLSIGSTFGGAVPLWFWLSGIGASLAFFCISVFLASFILKRTTYWEKGSFFRVFPTGGKIFRKAGIESGTVRKKSVRFGLNPIYRKECLESFLSRPTSGFKAAAVVFGIFLLLYLITLKLWPDLWFESIRGRYSHTNDNIFLHMSVIMGEFAIAFFSSTSAAAGSIVKERSKKTLDALLTTPLSSITIWVGKFLGVCRRGLLLFIVPFLHICLCIFHDIFQLHDLILTLLTATILFAFFIVVGLCFSTKFKKRTGAIVSTLGVAFLVFILIPIFAGILPLLLYRYGPDSSEITEIFLSMSPWYWVAGPMTMDELKDFYDYGIGYFWFLMVYGIITAILASVYAKTLRERVSEKE